MQLHLIASPLGAKTSKMDLSNINTGVCPAVTKQYRNKFSATAQEDMLSNNYRRFALQARRRGIIQLLSTTRF